MLTRETMEELAALVNKAAPAVAPDRCCLCGDKIEGVYFEFGSHKRVHVDAGDCVAALFDVESDAGTSAPIYECGS